METTQESNPNQANTITSAKGYYAKIGMKPRNGVSFDEYEPKTKLQSEAKSTLIELATDKTFGNNIFIHGNIGSGKTHLISALAYVALITNNGYHIRVDNGFSKYHYLEFATAIGLLSEIKATFNNDSGLDADDLIKKYSNCKILVIDDLGVEKCTDWVRETLYLIIDNRYNQYYPTWVTSNITPRELAERLDDRLVSRLVEDAIILKLDGNDYRITKKV